MPVTLHLGADWTVPQRHVLAILDLQTTDSAATQAFLRRARAQGHLITVPEGESKSAVIAVDDRGIERVYLSPIASATLRGRGVPLTGMA